MGVPSLYKWLTMRFPSIVTHLKKDFDYHVDNLFLDFNAIIHPCTNKNLKNLKEIDEALYRELEKYLDALMAFVKPKKMIYISIDGVAPKAKMNQQRTRRFGGAKEVYLEEQVYLTEEDNFTNKKIKQCFDSNCITPGTEFMERLDKYLQGLISFKLSTDPAWINKTVIYSSYRVPGEGEQKIFEYLRLHKRNAKESHVIFSPDADLLFLGLTLPGYNLKIMREEVKYNKDDEETGPRDYMESHFVFVNEQTLKTCITQKLAKELGEDVDEERLLADFVFLCFVVGNDFLPCVPCFEIRTNAIEKITTFLYGTYAKCKNYITNRDKTINYEVLKEFFAQCSVFENDNLTEKRANLIKSRNRMHLDFDAEIEYDLLSQENKTRYYVEKMGIKSEKDLADACGSFIKGMLWIYKYYFFECPSWDYYYPYYYAPFMCDLKEIDVIDIDFMETDPIKPFEQLLCVLPSMSMYLLPKSYRSFFYENEYIVPKEEYRDLITKTGFIGEFNRICAETKNKKLILRDCFTFKDLNFEVDTFQKVMDWQFLNILPFVDNQKILDYTKKHENELEFNEIYRNTAGINMLFTNKGRLVKQHEFYYKNPHTLLQETEYCGKVFTPNKINLLGVSVTTDRFIYINKAIAFDFDQKERMVLNKKPNEDK